MVRYLRWLLGLFAVVTSLVMGGTAVAQTESLDSSYEIAYGQKITFRLVGSIEADINHIELFLNTPLAATPLSVAVRFSQDDTQLVAGYDLDPKLAKLPPFVEVTYWWEMVLANGERLRVPEGRFIYEDDRFNWRVLDEEEIIVHWTGNDDALGRLAWEIAADSRSTLDQILPPTAVSPLRVYVYPSTADLRAGLLLAGRDWQGEHTDADLGVLLVTAVNLLTAEADLRQSIPHELAHLRLFQLAPTLPLPQWYEEGLALFVEGNSGGRADLVTTAVANDTVPTLLTLCTNFPQEAPERELALAQSVSLLRYIQDQFGDQALRQLGAVYQSGAGCETGLSQTLDLSLAELNADWLAAQAPQPGWITFLGRNGIWLLLLLAGFGLLALLLRR